VRVLLVGIRVPEQRRLAEGRAEEAEAERVLAAVGVAERLDHRRVSRRRADVRVRVAGRDDRVGLALGERAVDRLARRRS